MIIGVDTGVIDWTNFGLNALWIIGCAIALATLSYASWAASKTSEKLRIRLMQPQIQLSLNVAGVLFCLGLAGTSSEIWQLVLWILLAIGFFVQAGARFIKARSS